MKCNKKVNEQDAKRARWAKASEGERGAVIVLFSVGLVGMLMITGLAVDLGLAYVASSNNESVLTANATGSATPGNVDVDVLQVASVGRRFSVGGIVRSEHPRVVIMICYRHVAFAGGNRANLVAVATLWPPRQVLDQILAPF